MITKTFKTVLFVAFLFLSANTITAQYGNGYGGNGYGGGNNGYGGRSSQMGQMSQMNQGSQNPAPKAIPAEVTAAKIVEFYKKELTLDALQEVVLNNIYTKSLKKQDVLLQKKEMSDDDKTKEFKVLSEITDLEVMEILNKDQKAKYKILSEDRKNKIESQRH
ncbi:hypothetical protein FNW52_06300 [Flavobacterium sp. ZT3R18]|uniref:hypothetical protein n=1 Tax=Flavobacterium sp. ZT3R18 TaxID=2594429 RepID=UPI00117B4557|nr:hypothetical protein [Flavobacterium sp. ZT3R18]TRX36848.1 hypothetical protein FNW52_06300 [Flavobacterium sp. ZT3R18]